MHRRRFLILLACALVAGPMMPATGGFADDCAAPHPLAPPNDAFQGQCPVCGMLRSMWARTWITFEPAHGVSQVCSFHCLADWGLKSGAEPANVMLSVYHAPETAVPAETAHIVMGSAAAGTMSPVSKVVFADPEKAGGFAAACGGEVVDYAAALAAARANVASENRMIQEKRLASGKIVEPADADHCPVCNMIPARYPYGKCQARLRDGRTLHFCSTQCLFAYLGRPALYEANPADPVVIWVVDRPSGMWISGQAAFFVIGSSKVFGPMGYEAFPFDNRRDADDFASQNGGRTVPFGDVRIEDVVPAWKYR